MKPYSRPVSEKLRKERTEFRGGRGCLGEGRLGLPGQVWELEFLSSFASFPRENLKAGRQKGGRPTFFSFSVTFWQPFSRFQSLFGNLFSRFWSPLCPSPFAYPLLRHNENRRSKMSAKTPGSPRHPSSRHPPARGLLKGWAVFGDLQSGGFCEGGGGKSQSLGSCAHWLQ